MFETGCWFHNRRALGYYLPVICYRFFSAFTNEQYSLLFVTLAHYRGPGWPFGVSIPIPNKSRQYSFIDDKGNTDFPLGEISDENSGGDRAGG